MYLLTIISLTAMVKLFMYPIVLMIVDRLQRLRGTTYWMLHQATNNHLPITQIFLLPDISNDGNTVVAIQVSANGRSNAITKCF